MSDEWISDTTFKGAALGMMAAGLSLFGYNTWLSKKSYMVEWSASATFKNPSRTFLFTPKISGSTEPDSALPDNFHDIFLESVNGQKQAPPDSFDALQAADGGGTVLTGPRASASTTRTREWSGTVCFHERSHRIKDHSSLAARVLEEVRRTNPEIAAVDPNDITLSVINVNVL